MGSADVVPGVSGGTIAFLFGIYEELLSSIKSVASPVVLKALVRLDLKTVWEKTNASFLVSVGTGIIAAVLTLSHVFEWLLEHHPRPVWSFFFGLVLASAIDIGLRIRQWNLSLATFAFFGAIFAFLLVGASPTETPESAWFIFLCGAIVICAMILPGISGSFLLVLLGKYQFILQSVNDRNIVPIALFCLGAGFGIIAFAQVLGYFFKKYHDPTVALLVGLMLGSVRKLWPWSQEILSAPADYDVGNFEVIALIAFGILLVALLEKVHCTRLKKNDLTH